MQLYVIRHGIAEDARAGQADADRELTDDGVRKLRRVARGLRALGWRFDRVLTSPWQRAAQTAELLAPVRRHAPVATELLCDRPRAELLALIAEAGASASDPARIAVVGHQPWLGELLAWLAFGDPRHGHAFELRKGGVAWLDGSAVPGGMTIRGFVPPRLVRRLA